MYLIIGASGLIGNGLYRSLKKLGVEVRGTYFPNNNNIDPEDAIYLDLEQGDFGPVEGIDEFEFIVLCHGISNVDLCSQEKERAYKVNVSNTKKYLELFDPNKIIPVMLSTSMVYDGEKPAPNEYDQTNPIVEYGKQKLELEQYVEQRFQRSIILRLTKVFGVKKNDGTIFSGWIEQFKRGGTVKAVSDMFISPVFIDDVMEIMLLLMDKKMFGKFNLGGPKIETVYWFCDKVARLCSVPIELVRKVSIKELGLTEPRPKYNGLSSEKVLAVTKAKLTSYDKCLDLLVNN